MASLSASSKPSDEPATAESKQPQVSLTSEPEVDQIVTDEGEDDVDIESEPCLSEQAPVPTQQAAEEDTPAQTTYHAISQSENPVNATSPNSPSANGGTSLSQFSTLPVPSPPMQQLSQQSPQEHIESVLSEWAVPVSKRHTDVLGGSLNSSKDEHYTEKYHFIWELLQNADDNPYALGQIPTLTLSAAPGYLHVSNNETGFLPANVDAICSLHNSTKTLQKESSIGEKGVGFKSVFSVAAQVWVSSNGYTFRFDRDTPLGTPAPLGMVSPIWDAFPIQPIDGKQTHFYLKLSDGKQDCDQKRLRVRLRDLNGAALLFLRQLRRIHIATNDGKNTINGKLIRQIQRTDELKFGAEIARISTHRIHYKDLVDTIDYVIVRKLLQDMPADKKRVNVTKSEVTIAFPFRGEHPNLDAQHVFAFLPVRLTDFRFLLHGDFVLTTSREDVAKGNDWNDRLLAAVPECFLAAVARFNHEDARRIRYTWIAFLEKLESGSSSAFADLGDQIFDLLKQSPVLETQLGSFSTPNNIYLVDESFRSRDQTFILAKQSSYEYISPKYLQWDPTGKILARLGVQTITKEHFLRVLTEAATAGASSFRRKSSEWHSQLADIVKKTLVLADVRSLPLIPLTNGRWIASNEEQAFFSLTTSATKLKMPDGVSSLLTVDVSAANDVRRRELFKWLQVKELQIRNVYDSVLKLHSQPQPPAGSFHVLQSQLEFCFHHYLQAQKKGETVQLPSQFWVANSLRDPCLASTVYHDCALPSGVRVSSILKGEEWKTKMLLPSFMASHQASEAEVARWSAFLETHLKLKAHIQITTDGANFTSEFKYALETLPTEQFLEVLITSWLKLDKLMKITTLKQKLGALLVTSTSGSKIRLNQSFLPTQALVATGVDGVPFLKIIQPDQDRWAGLEEIGVVIKPDVKFYVYRLRSLMGTPVAKAEIEHIYSQIDAGWVHHHDLIREFFSTNAAVYIPERKTWLRKQDCVWAPTPGVVGECALSKAYPNLYHFFFTKLWVRTVSIGSVVAQLLNMTRLDRDDPEQRRQLLIALNKFLKRKPSDHGKIDGLRDQPVMPTKNGALQPLNRLNWVFCDRARYGPSFKNCATTLLADFSVQECMGFQPLAEAIKNQFGNEQRLSELVTDTEECGEVAVLNITLTNYIRKKLRVIRSLVRDPRAGIGGVVDTIFVQLAGLQVYHAPMMKIVPHLNRGNMGAPIIGKPLFAQQVIHTVSSNAVSLYIKEIVDAQKPSPDLLLQLSSEVANVCGLKDECLINLLEKVLQGSDEYYLDDLLATKHVDCSQDLDYEPKLLKGFEASEGEGFEEVAEYAVRSSAPTSSDFEAFTSIGSDSSAGYFPDSESDNNALQTEPKPAPTTLLYQGAGSSRFDGFEIERHRLRVIETASRPPRGTRGSDQRTDPLQHVKTSNRRLPIAVPATSSRPFAAASPSAPSTARSQPYRAPTEEEKIREQQVGLLGEKMTYDLLGEIFDGVLSESEWTSELREGAGMSPWSPKDRNKTFTDFTVTDDEEKRLLRWLREEQVKMSPGVRSKASLVSRVVSHFPTVLPTRADGFVKTSPTDTGYCTLQLLVLMLPRHEENEQQDIITGPRSSSRYPLQHTDVLRPLLDRTPFSLREHTKYLSYTPPRALSSLKIV